MDSSALQEWRVFAESLADMARAMLVPNAHLRPSKQVKTDKSFVTALDAQIEAALRDRIGARYPTHGILGEEQDAKHGNADITWVLDPIDGTAPFIAGVPVFGTLIAVAVEGVPVIGVMDLPMTSQRWVGVAGTSTNCNGQVVRTRTCESLAAAMMTNSNPDFLNESERPALDALKTNTAWRIYGGCCMSYGLLANGRTDLALDANFKVWDYAPFRPIIEGAGGVISDWEGRPLTLESGTQVLAAGDAARHAEACAIVQSALA